MTNGVYDVTREGQWEPQRINNAADALIDLIIAKPGATNEELGAVLGRTKQWVSLVKNSGLFKERLHLRKTELVDPLLIQSVEDRMQALTDRSLEILQEKLAQPAAVVPDSLALAAAQLGAKGMGLGGFSSKPPPAPPVAPVGRLERLADRLLALNKRDVIDVQAREAA